MYEYPHVAANIEMKRLGSTGPDASFITAKTVFGSEEASVTIYWDDEHPDGEPRLMIEIDGAKNFPFEVVDHTKTPDRVRLDSLGIHHLFYPSDSDRSAWQVVDKDAFGGVKIQRYVVHGDPGPKLWQTGSRMVVPVE